MRAGQYRSGVSMPTSGFGRRGGALPPRIAMDLIRGAQIALAPLFPAWNRFGNGVHERGVVAPGSRCEEVDEGLHLLGRVHVPADAAAIPVLEIHGKLPMCGRELPLRRTERRMWCCRMRLTITARGE